MKRSSRSICETVQPGDVVGIGIHTGNALRGYEIGTLARARGATVVFGGIHATLYPDEALKSRRARTPSSTAMATWRGRSCWETRRAARCSQSTRRGASTPIDSSLRAGTCCRRDATCGARCRRCAAVRSIARSARCGAPTARRRASVAPTSSSTRSWNFVDEDSGSSRLADDNFYPVTLTDLALAERQRNVPRLEQLRALRAERFELMDQLAQLPSDMVFFTQITMEAAEDPAFLTAMRRANIKGALVGVEAVTPEGLKDVFKGFNDVGEALVQRLRTFREHGVYVLGSFIFGLPSDRPSTFAATADIADRAGLAFAQFVMLTPYPGTVDFAAWEKRLGDDATRIAGIPITRHWLIPQAQRPKVYAPHPVMSPDEIRARTQAVWDQFYSLRRIWSAIALHADASSAPGVRVDLEAVSADVCEHRDRDRQCACEPRQPVGSPDCQTVPPTVHGRSAACPSAIQFSSFGRESERPFVVAAGGLMLYEFITHASRRHRGPHEGPRSRPAVAVGLER